MKGGVRSLWLKERERHIIRYWLGKSRFRRPTSVIQIDLVPVIRGKKLKTRQSEQGHVCGPYTEYKSHDKRRQYGVQSCQELYSRSA